jgi:hypothetical protein
MTPRIPLILAVAVAALALGIPSAFGEGRLAGSPEPVDAIAYFHANELATAAQSVTTDLTTYRDAAERASVPVESAPSPTTGSGLDLAWPQLGIGFGAGILLVLCVLLVVRTVRIRPLAH